jgi:hypothetical protein
MWIAVIAGVAGLVGVLAGGVLQLEASRRALLREKQLAAAEEVDAAAGSIFMGLERRARDLNARGVEGLTTEQREAWLASSRASAADAREDARRILALSSRIELLFGEESSSARALGPLSTTFMNSWRSLRTRPLAPIKRSG